MESLPHSGRRVINTLWEEHYNISRHYSILTGFVMAAYSRACVSEEWREDVISIVRGRDKILPLSLTGSRTEGNAVTSSTSQSLFHEGEWPCYDDTL